MLFGMVGSHELPFSLVIDHTIVVVISNRLVTSPVAIVADMGGYTANYQRILGKLTYLFGLQVGVSYSCCRRLKHREITARVRYEGQSS